MKKKQPIITKEERAEYQDKFNLDCFSNHLKLLLKEAGMTQKELAEQLEVQPLQITRWVKGNVKTEVPYKHIKKISRLFHVDEEWLYNPNHGIRNVRKMIEDNIEVMESVYLAQKKPLIDYLNSLGYKVENTGGSYDDSKMFNDGSFSATLNHFVMKDGNPICEFDETLEKRISLAVEYTLLK